MYISYLSGRQSYLRSSKHAKYIFCLHIPVPSYPIQNLIPANQSNTIIAAPSSKSSRTLHWRQVPFCDPAPASAGESKPPQTALAASAPRVEASPGLGDLDSAPDVGRKRDGWLPGTALTQYSSLCEHSVWMTFRSSRISPQVALPLGSTMRNFRSVKSKRSTKHCGTFG